MPARRLGRITFGSLHRLSKINALVIDLWSQVLRALPSARLLVFRNTLTGKTKEDMRRQFAERGIGSDQLCLQSVMPARGHLAVYGDIDIALDTVPYGGGTTSYECLWMGVPVLTLRGDRCAGRAGASLLTSVGLPELIAESPEQFVALAVKWAGDSGSAGGCACRSA